MIKQEVYIEFIINELRSGNVSFNSVYELNRTKYNLHRPTFSKYWKLANERYWEEYKEVKKMKFKESLKNAKSETKKQIITKEQALEILSEIAQGTERRIRTDAGEEVIFPSASEQIRAIDQMSKIEGWIAPQKINMIKEDESSGLVVMSLSELMADVRKK